MLNCGNRATSCTNPISNHIPSIIQLYPGNMMRSEMKDTIQTMATPKVDEFSMTADEKRLAEMGIKHDQINIGTIH